MKFEIYCDESGLEVLADKKAHLFMGIGGIWIPAEQRGALKEGLKSIKANHGIRGELKWNKVSPGYFNLYKEVIDFFFNAGYIRFRVILIESEKIDNIHFNNSDGELGFYKFYYQLIKHWIFDFNDYYIFTDLKKNRDSSRLQVLEQLLDNANLTSDIVKIQGLPSEQSPGIQLADILLGMVVAKFNKNSTSAAKTGLIEYVEQKYLGKEISPTPKWEEKMNVFKINLQGGW